MTSKDLKKIVFNEAVRRVHEHYGIFSQFTIDGTTADNFMLIPRTDRGYDVQDLRNLGTDMGFLTEQIKAECEGVK